MSRKPCHASGYDGRVGQAAEHYRCERHGFPAGVGHLSGDGDVLCCGGYWLSVASSMLAGMCTDILFRLATGSVVKTFPKFYFYSIADDVL